MFCPDNFYEILRSKYSWPRTPNLLLFFNPHGSKNLWDIQTFLDFNKNTQFDTREFNNHGNYAALGKILLHDQEPFSFIDATHTYRQFLKDHLFQKEYKTDPRIRKILDTRSPENLLTGAIRSGMQPIFCHSELNSPDVKAAVDGCLAIECYYWYHAMISRDWFRHWQHHPDIMPKDRSDAPYRFMLYARGLDGTRAYRRRFLDLIQSYRNQIFCGQNQITTISSNHSAKIDVEDANIATIHIVLETLFETSKIHLTEKVFKPMVMSQPFFLLSGPGSLKYLRDYGFQTFGDFWNEGYDLIEDHNERMNRIKQEIEKILFLPAKEFQDLYRSMLPVVAHNRRRFFSQEFQDHCIKEMEDNFQSALNLQKENINTYPGGSWTRLLAQSTKEKMMLNPHWPGNMRNFLNSEYLQASKEKIVEVYPVLSEYLY